MMSTNKHSDNLTLLKKICAKYKNNSEYVYKLSQDVLSKKDTTRKWLIIMKKTKETKTNEQRSGVFDGKYAAFRASELKVIKIININNPKLTKKYVTNIFLPTIIRYKVGTIARSDSYDENINNIFSNGIHYFKTMIAAYYYAMPIEYEYSGHRTTWYVCGRKESEGEFLDGKEINHWTYWTSNGNKLFEGDYINGELTGYWIIYYADRNVKFSEGIFSEGSEIGHWIFWHDNEEKFSEGEFLGGRRTGSWKFWHDNGEKSAEGNFLKGNRTGHWTFWDDDGKKTEEYEYLNGERISGVKFWNGNNEGRKVTILRKK